MDSVQRLECLIISSKSQSRMEVRRFRRINNDHGSWIKKLAWDNIKLLNELEEVLQDYKSGDRKPLDYYIQTRLRRLPLSETNYKIENLLKTIWPERVFFVIINYKYNKELIQCRILI